MPSISTSQYDYSFLSPNGVDHRLIALYCVGRITNGFTSASYVRTDSWEKKLQTFISTIVFRSNLSIGVLISALSLIEQLQTILNAHDRCLDASLDDTKRIFLISYMMAAKIMYDNQMTLVWWKRVIQREYDCEELSDLELRFYQTLDWDVQIAKEDYYRIFREAVSWHEAFVSEHTLPASPLPTYSSVREPRAAVKGSRLFEEPITGLEDCEKPTISRSLELPLPCAAASVHPHQGIVGSMTSFGRWIFQIGNLEA